AQREPRLEHLRRIKAAVAVDGYDAIVAIMAVAPAPAAGHDVIAGEILVIYRMIAAEDKVGAGAAFRCHDALRHAGSHCANSNIGKPGMGLRVAGDERAWVVDIRHLARR